MSSYKVTPISPSMQLGEGPHWIEKEQSLLFIDYPGGTINKIFYESKRHQVLDLEIPSDASGPSVSIPVEGYEDKFVVGLGHDLACVEWKSSDPDYKKVKPVSLLRFDDHLPKNGLNDAKCDPEGRLWIGSKGAEEGPGIITLNQGSLFRVDSDFKVTEHVNEVSISNGLTWSLDSKVFYYIDTLAFTVDAFDYDRKSGAISNRRVIFDVKACDLTKDGQGPDGMTIDNDGNLWVVFYNGSKVICIDPKVGKLIRKIDIPSIYTTSCCFGGPDYSTLFVTSANRWLSEDDLKLNPDSGKTFAVTGLGVKGSPHQNFKVDKSIFEKKAIFTED